MSNASKVKAKKIKIQLDKERTLYYDLNAFVELEEKFGSINDALKALSEASVKALRTILWVGLIHEDPGLTECQVGAMVDFTALNEITEKINEAIMDALPPMTPEEQAELERKQRELEDASQGNPQ